MCLASTAHESVLRTLSPLLVLLIGLPLILLTGCQGDGQQEEVVAIQTETLASPPITELELTQALITVCGEIKAMKASLQQHGKKLLAAQEDITTLQADQLCWSEEVRDTNDAAIAGLQSMADQLSALAEQYQQSEASKSQQLQTLQANRDRLQETLTAHQQKTTTQAQQIATLLEQCSRLEEHVSSLRSELTATQQRMSNQTLPPTVEDGSADAG